MKAEYFKNIFDYSPLPIYIFQDMAFRMVNPKMAQITGYSQEELLNLDFSILIHPGDRLMVADNARRRLSGEKLPEEYPFRAINRNGQTIHVMGYFSVIQFNERPAIIGQLLDVTGQKNTEEALRSSEKELAKKVDHLNTLINNMNELFYTYDRQGCITYANKKTFEVLGYVPEELIGRNIFEFIPSRHKEDVICKVNERLHKQKSDSYEIPFIHKNGRERIIRLNASPISEDDRVSGGMVLAEDITGRKRSEEIIREERFFVSAILNTAGSLIVVLQRDGRIVRFNRACERLTGYSFHEVRDKYIWDLLLVAEEADAVKKVFDNLLSGLFPSTAEYYWLTCNGDRRLISWSNTAMLDKAGRVKYVICTGIDITERRRAEERVLRERERLFVTLSSIGDAVIAVDKDGRITMLNPVAETLTGWGMEEALGWPLEDVFRIINEYTGEPAENPVKKVLADGKIVGLANHTALITREGEIRSIADSAAPIRDAAGNIFGVILVFRDVTEEKLQEEALKASEARLRLITDNMRDMISQTDERGVLIFVSPSVKSVLGYNYLDMVGKNAFELVHPEDLENVINVIQNAITTFSAVRMEYRCKHANGTYIWLETVGNPVFDEGTRFAGIILGSRDITQRKLAEGELINAHQQLLDIIEFLPDATFVIDSGKKVIAWNKAIEEMTGILKKDIIGKGDYAYSVPFYGIPRPILIDRIIGENPEIENKYDIIRWRGKTAYSETFVPFIYNGKGAFLSAMASPLYDTKGTLTGAIETIRDITERKIMEEKMKHLSFHDGLTGLYNRACFEQEMKRLDSAEIIPVSIIVCDVDGLKLINDTLGHDSGDAMLVAAAGVIRGAFRKGDMVARIGGDEFAVLLPKADRISVEEARRRILDAVDWYNRDNKEIPLSISVGYATCNGEYGSPADIFKEADNNMYREKLYRSQSARSAIVQTLMKTLEARDFITEGHAERLQKLVAGMAAKCGMSAREITDLRLLAQFHDIGKVGIPDRILNKPGPLNEEEFNEMRRHCEIGHRIAQSSPDLVVLADWILKHHEWWDGQGYPLGLKGENIPLECRILCIADAYDAMTSDRPYRKAMSQREALDEIKKCSGTQFDPQLVSVFISMMGGTNNKHSV